jgi:hypothetical protein
MCLETSNLWVIAERILLRPLEMFSINMLAGIVRDWLVGPHVVPHRLTGSHYQDFLSHDLPKLLQVVPVAVKARMWYIHDGAPAHFSRVVRDILNNTYHDRWICRGGPTAWPPRTPGLHPVDLLPVRTPKTPCLCSSCWQQRIISPSHCGCPSDYPQLPWHPWTVRRSVMVRVEESIKSRGGHLGTYSKCTLSELTN